MKNEKKAKYAYYLLNKPNDVISTHDDPKNRKNLNIFLDQIKEEVFAVGRLDRKTTGLMLLTNDGDLANQLLHPRYQISKIYEVELDKKISHEDMNKCKKGFFLEDGPIKFETIEVIAKTKLIISLHEGRNKIIRRTFAYLNYDVKKLKRTQIGSLTLDQLKTGQIRPCTTKEIKELKSHLK